MKRIFKILLVILFVGVVAGCEKNVSKVSYAKFNEYFSDKEDFNVSDDTSGYDMNVRKYITANNSKYQIYYIEYDSERSANEYINNLNSDSKDYNIKKYDKYTYVENTNGKYVVMYKIDSTIVVGMSDNKNYKRDINNILSDLGY